MRRLSAFAAVTVLLAFCGSPAHAEYANYRIHMTVIGDCADAFDTEGGLHQIAPIEEGAVCTASIKVSPRSSFAKRSLSSFGVILGAILPRPSFKQVGRAALKSGAAHVRFKWSDSYCFVAPRLVSQSPGGPVVGELRTEVISSLALKNGQCFKNSGN